MYNFPQSNPALPAQRTEGIPRNFEGNYNQYGAPRPGFTAVDMPDPYEDKNNNR